MNPLQDLLDGQEGSLDLQHVREATAASLHALRHDRRLEHLGLAEVRELTTRIFHTPDIRTLSWFDLPPPREQIELEIRNLELYVNQMLFEVVDEDALQYDVIRRAQRAAASRGGQLRLAPVPYRLYVYNRQFALVSADFDDSAAGAIAIREPELVSALTSLHARIWQGGRKWHALGRGGVDLSDVLGELLMGSTDEASAERLHVSLRTYRRKVRELLELLGASSRFQAGAIAEQRRYLDLVRPESRPLDVVSDPYEAALDEVRLASS